MEAIIEKLFSTLNKTIKKIKAAQTDPNLQNTTLIESIQIEKKKWKTKKIDHCALKFRLYICMFIRLNVYTYLFLTKTFF